MGFSRETRIRVMLSINAVFFIAEIVVGFYSRSLALVADSFHMLNDMLSLVVALWAIRVASVSQFDPSRYSYGWQRAEILGALINAVFLLALCVTILIEAIQRFVSPEAVTDPMLVLIVACAGLAGNLVGVFLFHEHSHLHHHHHSNKQHQHTEVESQHQHKHDEGHLNMRGVFLHVAGDALGNVGVIASTLVIWLTDGTWRYYLDPAVSLLIAIIICISAIPLIRETSFILLQGSNVALDDVKSEISRLDGVLSVHELHIWQLSDTKYVASVHVKLRSQTIYMAVASTIRQIMHAHGVHSVTIQPEVKDDSPRNSFDSQEQETVERKERNVHTTYNDPDFSSSSETMCLLRCADTSCDKNACCPPPS
ncbi:cation efflux protein [Dichotomocladium elegans]|nr:cation efflux protein [Dichotomocladium elegans]